MNASTLAIDEVRPTPQGDVALVRISELARGLRREGRVCDALMLLNHLESLQPGDAGTLRQLANILGVEGRTLAALEKLCALKAVTADKEALLDDIRAQLPAAMRRFNDHLAANELEQAEKYAAAMAALVPGNVALLNSALSCNLALRRYEQAKKYASAILRFDPNHAAARALLASHDMPDVGSEIERRVAQVLSEQQDAHPLLRLRDLHDVVSLILCETLTDTRVAQIGRLLDTARRLTVDVPAGSELAGWETHYRLALKAIDIDAVIAPTPQVAREPALALASSTGKNLSWSAVQARVKRVGAKAVFFAAADRKYVDLYAPWYIKSVLKYCDVGCLVVVHVIGGAGQLKEVARSLGIVDERLIFAGDRFDAKRIETKCYDTPPKGLIAMPVAHFQSIRFLRLGALLQQLRLPVFVSDIDLILQRGVKDLLQRAASTDVMLNENTLNKNAGSRLTANLLLVKPTKNAALFLRFLRATLEKALAGDAVSRWIDQFTLLLARHHLERHGKAARIGYFDTDSDINNVMYKSYQDHPFRFLSLYHGFDTSSLEQNPNVLGNESEKVGTSCSTMKSTRRKKSARSRHGRS